MKKSMTAVAVLCLFASLFAEERITKRFADSGKALLNPSMGWMAYQMAYPVYDPADTLDDFPGCSTVYLRVSWARLQPTEGFIDWSIIDNVAQRYAAKGKKVALRLTTSMTGDPGYAGTPKWVHDAGARMIPYADKGFGHKGASKGSGKVSMEPVFDDPVYLKKLEKFLSEAGKRYNGNPNVAFIDVGTFGTWGEGHTVYSHKLSPEETARQARIHVALHRKYFPDTLLTISDDVIGHNAPGDDFPLLKEFREQGITLRDDSILVGPGWYHDAVAQHYWPKMPVILEHQHLQTSVHGKFFRKEKLLEAVEKYHASYLSIHAYSDYEKSIVGDYVEKINKRLGYRIQIRSVSYPAVIRPGKMYRIETELANAGVAPCYPGGVLTFTIKDPKTGSIIAVQTDDTLDVRSLRVGPADRIPVHKQVSHLRLNPNAPKIVIPNGKYDLYVSVGDRMGTPKLALPLKDDDGHHRYKIGQITIDSEFIGPYQGKAAWIWDKITTVSFVKTYVTKTVELAEAPRSAKLRFAIDDFGDAYVNGTFLKTQARGWGIMREVDVTKLLHPGTNLIAIEGKNNYVSCGIIAEIVVEKKDGSIERIVSDRSWRASDKPAPNWEKDPAVSQKWAPAAMTVNDKRVLIYK